MNLLEIFFAFHRPASLLDVGRGAESWRCIFGHVEAYGFTVDDTWLFFNPEGAGTSIHVTHLYDEVVDRIASIRSTARSVLAFKPDGRSFRVPFHPPMNCVTQCAALIGRRAYTPWGFHRMLLAEGAEIIHENTQRRSQGQRSAAS